MIAYGTKAMIVTPLLNPSMPSVRFTAFELPANINNTSRKYSHPKESVVLENGRIIERFPCIR